VAVVLSSAYGYGLLLDAVKPELRSPIPWMSFVALPLAQPFELVRTCVLASWGIALAVSLFALVRQRRAAGRVDGDRVRGMWQVGVSIVLLAPFPLFPIVVLAENLGATAVCVPSTAFALWAITRTQRFRRMPVWLPFLGLAWGCLVAAGFAASMNGWFVQYGAAYLVDLGEALQDPEPAIQRLIVARSLSTGFFEELGKAAGVAVLYFWFRRHVDDVVSGIVIGAAVGLGFNFSESVLYMGGAGGSAAYQYWARQSVGLFASHVAFTALVGAGFGAARQLHEPWRKILAVSGGFLAGASTHFANNALMGHMIDLRDHLFGTSAWLRDLVGTPLTIVVLQGPLVLLYLLLLRRGIRSQTGAMAAELTAEAQTGHGAVTEDEVPTLLRPARRFYLRYKAFRRGGRTSSRHLKRLWAAQLELATLRWHRSRDEIDPSSPGETALRERVLRIKDEQPAASGEPRPVEVPA
jgi:RsiW-degrading membrane proteinase PrsW (M82 family)